MSEPVQISSTCIAKLANDNWGTKETVLYYTRLAKQASERAKAAAAIPNAVTMAMELQTIHDAVLAISNLLNDDKVNLPQEK